MVSKLTALEKKIKRINTRIVDQVKKYGLNNPLTREYIENLEGQSFVKEVKRKIGVDSKGNNVYAIVPQLKTSKKYDTNQKRFIGKFEAKDTVTAQIKNYRKELGGDFTDEEVEQRLIEYMRAGSDMKDTLSAFYELSTSQQIALDEDIAFFRKRGQERDFTREEFLQHYLSLKGKV